MGATFKLDGGSEMGGGLFQYFGWKNAARGLGRWPTRKLLAALCLAMAGLALSGCSKAYVWHQKMTVLVTTPTGDVPGSSVTEDKNYGDVVDGAR